VLMRCNSAPVDPACGLAGHVCHVVVLLPDLKTDWGGGVRRTAIHCSCARINEYLPFIFTSLHIILLLLHLIRATAVSSPGVSLNPGVSSLAVMWPWWAGPSPLISGLERV